MTVQSVATITSFVYTAGKKALNHVQLIAEVIGQTFAYWCYTGMRNKAWYPLIVMSPSVAKAIAEDGWSKDDIRRYLYDNVKITASAVEKYARSNAHNDFDLKIWAERGLIPKEYYESDDPNRLVRVFLRPEWIGLVVSGDPGRNQSKGYVQNHRMGPPEAKRSICQETGNNCCFRLENRVRRDRLILAFMQVFPNPANRTVLGP